MTTDVDAMESSEEGSADTDIQRHDDSGYPSDSYDESDASAAFEDSKCVASSTTSNDELPDMPEGLTAPTQENECMNRF